MQAKDLYRILFDDKYEVKNLTFFSDEVAYAVYREKEGFVPQLVNANVVIGEFTLSHARLHLYGCLEQLGRQVIYFDTDSIVQVTRPGQKSFPVGRYFGELTDKLDEGDHIVKSVSAGPKNYSFRTASGKVVCKIRGFTLNFLNAQHLNLESMLDVVVHHPRKEVMVTDPCKIVRDHKEREVLTVSQNKRYKLVCDKRVRARDGSFDTFPYRY